MAFRTNRLQRVFQQITDEAADIKSRAQSLRNASAAGPVQSSQIIDWFVSLANARTVIAALASTPGLPAYAQNEVDDDTYNVTTEYTAMLAAIDGALAWVTTNFPKDGSGYLLAYQFIGNAYTARTFSTAALATFRTTLDSLIATIA